MSIFAAVPDEAVNIRLDTDPVCFMGRVTMPPEEDLNEFIKTAFAIRTIPDGSCFYHACSRLQYGRQGFAMEMRVRLIVEFLMNEDRYLQSKTFDASLERIEGKSHLHRLLIYASNETPEHLTKEGEVQHFRDHVMGTLNPNEYAALLDIFGMANVLNRPIVSIFPKFREGSGGSWFRQVYKDHQCIVFPSDPEQRLVENAFFVHWTKAHPDGIIFNHFNAVVP